MPLERQLTSLTNLRGSPNNDQEAKDRTRARERQSIFDAQKKKAVQYQSPERNVGYETGGVYPVGGFMHLLAPTAMDEDGIHNYTMLRKRFLSLWIPDTIVWESEGKPTWYFTNSNGVVLKTTDFGISHVVKRFQKKQRPHEAVAVLKASCGSRNNITLVDTSKLKETIETQGSPQSPVVLQRFILPKGARASMYRCSWSALHNTVFHVNCIRSKHKIDDEGIAKEVRMLPSNTHPESIDCYELKAAAMPGISQAMQNLLHYLAEEKQLFLDEFVCDFLVDSCNQVWFLQVKAFTRRQVVNTEPKRVPSVLPVDDPGPGVREFCGFCGCVFRHQDLTHLLTVRQILEVHERLRDCGTELSWARSPQTMRLATRPTLVSGPMLHVCEACHSLHHALAELSAVSTAFHARLGVPAAPAISTMGAETLKKPASTTTAVLMEPPRTEAIHRSPSAPSMGSGAAMTPGPQMPRSWQCTMGSSDAVTVLRAHGPGVRSSPSSKAVNEPPRQLMLRYRFLILLQELVLDEKSESTLPDGGCLTVTFTLFGVKHRIPLQGETGDETSSPRNDVQRVDSLRIIHVFVTQPNSLSTWAKKHAPLELRVMSGRETLFVTSVPLRRVVTVAEAHGKDDKKHRLALEDAEMQFLDLPLRRPGARVVEGRFRTVFGISGGEVADCSSISLRLESGLVYVPPQSFTLPEVLPPQWLTVLTHPRSSARKSWEQHDDLQKSTKLQSLDATGGMTADLSDLYFKLRKSGKPLAMEPTIKSNVLLRFRLRGLHNLPGAHPGDPYMVELVLFGFIRFRQQTFCIERVRPGRNTHEVLAPMQLDASLVLDGLSTDSLCSTLCREDAAHVKCVRQGGSSALCPALQVKLPVDRLVNSGAKRMTGAFELSPPPDAPAGSTRNGELAHLFAGFQLKILKEGKNVHGDIPVVQPANDREERLAGVGSRLPPTLVLRQGAIAEKELPQHCEGGARRRNRPVIYRASTQLGSQLSGLKRFQSQRDLQRKVSHIVFEQEQGEGGEQSEDSDASDDDDDASDASDDVLKASSRKKLARRSSFVAKSVAFDSEESDNSSETDAVNDHTFSSLIEEYKKEPKLAMFLSELRRSQLDKLRYAFAAYSSTGECSTGRLPTEDLSKVLSELGYEVAHGQWEATCLDLGIVNRETGDIGFAGFLALTEAHFRELVEHDPNVEDLVREDHDENIITLAI